MKLIDPLNTFGPLLNSVQVPSRYVGGEFGVTIKNHADNDRLFNFAVAFPDMYEIAMSNLAVKIIYNGLNSLPNVRCERVFAPAPDFEELMKSKEVPLYTLETGMPLCSTDMIGFSIGYELGITEVIAMLEDGKVPAFAADRKEGDPIVIAGGCGVTNPAAFSDFFDAFIIGEAEPVLFEMVSELASMKEKGASRNELLAFMETKSFIWTKKKCTGNDRKVARRAVQNNFGLVPSIPSWFPLPSNRPVQDHGVIEIMRGCPNGCRFCHAGVYYRPTRVKNLKLIIDEIDHLVFDAGYREISLNSLSSADFPDVGGLLDLLNERYKGFNVSFQLPSLKVNSMSLDILEKLSTVRKSGLTFAVETPEEMWQLSLNKEVYAQHLEEIVREAKKRGWSSAKFYFMIGLPLGDYFSENKLEPGSEGTEERAIVDFLIPLQARTKIQCNVNVGVFIPKPHTAYERMKQITPEEAQKKIDYIYQNLPRGKFKIGRHNFNATILEGLLSRGDHRAGKVIYSAYRKGARFDAWDEYLRENFGKWQEAFEEADYDVLDYIYKEWSFDEELPWSGVSLGPSPSFYKKEWDKSLQSVLTPKCTSNCDHRCGICNTAENVEVYTPEKIESVSKCLQNKTIQVPETVPECNIQVMYRVIFNFQRKDGGEFTAYLSQVEIFHKAILRSGLRFVFTSGFNPLPRLEFATAMTLGVPSYEETASCLLYDDLDPKIFIEAMNKVLPDNLHVTEAFIFPVTNLRKRESLTTGLWGAVYTYRFNDKAVEDSFFASDIYKAFKEDNPEVKVTRNESITVKSPVSDKKLRQAIEEFTCKKWFQVVDVVKIQTLAKPEISGWTAADEDKWRHDSKNFKKTETESEHTEPIPFMELYKQIARINKELIEKRQELTQEQVKFYEDHPDVKSKRMGDKK
ncbi:TIGR03960 family B12-binding radical SAM protein [Treponema sp.]|uniref:TIGR03960 family B12-binding radical SAM protein n=1 Tax=Treponema sp. TaxID=166 RepID=UPI00388EB4D4